MTSSDPCKKGATPGVRTFRRFTDDAVLGAAVADSILTGVGYAEKLKEYFRYCRHTGYGGSFRAWAVASDSRPYNRWGNGSAMRVSPVAFAFDTLEDVLGQARQHFGIVLHDFKSARGVRFEDLSNFLSHCHSFFPHRRDDLCTPVWRDSQHQSAGSLGIEHEVDRFR